jgi:hypothetical protein
MDHIARDTLVTGWRAALRERERWSEGLYEYGSMQDNVVAILPSDEAMVESRKWSIEVGLICPSEMFKSENGERVDIREEPEMQVAIKTEAKEVKLLVSK